MLLHLGDHVDGLRPRAGARGGSRAAGRERARRSTRLTSISVPTFGAFSVLAIRFLERSASHAAPSAKALAASRSLPKGLRSRSVLGYRSAAFIRAATGRRGQLSDVRGDQGRNHVPTVPQRASNVTRRTSGLRVLKAGAARNLDGRCHRLPSQTQLGERVPFAYAEAGASPGRRRLRLGLRWERSRRVEGRERASRRDHQGGKGSDSLDTKRPEGEPSSTRDDDWPAHRLERGIAKRAGERPRRRT